MAQVLVEFILDRIARTAAPSARGVATLDHEVGDDAMEDGSVVEALLREIDEVLGGDRRLVFEQLHFERAGCRVERRGSIGHRVILSQVLVFERSRSATRQWEAMQSSADASRKRTGS